MITEEVVHGWWKGKNIRDPQMTNSRIADWIRVLDPYRDQVYDILEIGSFEGQSAIFWLEFFPKSQLTCVDWFGGSIEHRNSYYEPLLEDLESRFDSNVESYGSRVTKMSMPSSEGLPILIQQQRSFDLIYIDGSHEIDDVYLDTVQTWGMLRLGGVVIWDDYDTFIPSLRPVVDEFLDQHSGELTVLHRLMIPHSDPNRPSPLAQQLYAVRTKVNQQ